jgi:hypothetical protein
LHSMHFMRNGEAGKYGPLRGPYDQEKTEQFIDHLFNISSMKIFKT